MSIQFIITEEEINETPNDFELGRKIRSRYYKMCNNFVSNDGYDLCVICGKKTPYKTTDHIDYRIGYVEGVGQTCPSTDECNKN